MFDLLVEPLIRVEPVGLMSLPGLLAALARDEVESLRGLRPHQLAAWHMFLVQLAALALLAEQPADDIPKTEETWRRLLSSLTSAFPHGDPWHLVGEDWSKPAFLQPPVPAGVELKNTVATPDALDLLITARNHDLKQAVAARNAPQDWLFALVSLQTGDGYNGAGNQGIARMNGGASSRVLFSLAPLPKGEKAGTPRPGAWFRRDVRALLLTRAEEWKTHQGFGYPETGGLGLTWLAPWPEGGQLQVAELDLWFIEVCRRVRLTWGPQCLGGPQGLGGRKGTSKETRINGKHLSGALGDPFAPVHRAAHKSLTLSDGDFDYRRLVDLLLSGDWVLPVLARPAPFERPGEELALVCMALARGNSKTDGFKSRVLPFGGKISWGIGTRRQELHELAEAQMTTIDAFGKTLAVALALAAADGDSERVGKAHYVPGRQARDRFTRAADEIFFEHLRRRFEAQDPNETSSAKRNVVRAQGEFDFVEALVPLVERAFDRALPTIRCASLFRPRAQVRATDALYGWTRRRRREAGDHLREATADAA